MSTSKRTNAGGLSSSDGHNASPRVRPTDMELMLYFDGELSEPRRAEVESFVARDSSATNKLSGLRVSSGLVRERALAVDMGGDIAASVLSAIEAGIDKQKSAGSKPIGFLPVRPAGSSSKPANDNSRSIFTLAAIAVAAAAAMMIWSRTPPDAPNVAKGDAPAATQEARQPASDPQKAAVEAAPAEAPPAEAELEHGVEVAAVDFGAHMGTIFYVPSDAAASSATTTVVWVDDDVAGGK